MAAAAYYFGHELVCAWNDINNALNPLSNSNSINNSAPDVPDNIVGSPPNNPTKPRTNSGPLDPSYGGTGDPAADFDLLTGGTGRPADPNSDFPPGTIIGDNDIQLRPGNKNDGPRIDIPSKGTKPRETLHYPPSNPGK